MKSKDNIDEESLKKESSFNKRNDLKIDTNLNEGPVSGDDVHI